jgi:hypothetical protein
MPITCGCPGSISRKSRLKPHSQACSSGIQVFAQYHNLSGLYHETITTAWVHLLASHQLLAAHEENSFNEFLAMNESRLRSNLLHRFWTPEILASREARSHWVPPDRRELPRLPR